MPGDYNKAVAIIVLATALLVAMWSYIGMSTAFLPCTLDCGETYESHIGALNLYRFGLRYTAGLQDFAVSAEASAHPTIYTHNANIAMYYLYLLFLLGIHDLHAQTLAVLPVFAAGLVYLYLFLRAVTRDALMAALGLLTAASLYLLVILWAFSPLRGFSWLITFGALYHLLRFARERRWIHGAAAGFFMAMSFGIDYPFAVFLATTVVALRTLRLLPMKWSRVLALLVLAFGIPFALRQAQVAAGVGVDLWAMDLKASIVRRMPLIGLVVTPPDAETLKAIYAERHVVKWPGEGTFRPARWLGRVTLTYLNVLTPAFVIPAGVWLAIVLKLRRRGVRVAVRSLGRPVVAASCVAVALAAGMATTFVIFGEYFAAFYGVLVTPLVVHWVVVVLALTTYLLITHRRSVVTFAGRAIPLGAVVLVAFVVWRAGTEIRNYMVLPPRPYPGRVALEAIKGRSVATFWISSAPSAYTNEWAASLNDPRWRFIRPEDLPFDPARDYYFFMEADKSNPRYRRPDFLFIPALNVPVLDNRVCRPLHGRIMAFADGCSDLDVMAKRLAWLPLYSRGPDFLLYDLRDAYGAAKSTEPDHPR